MPHAAPAPLLIGALLLLASLPAFAQEQPSATEELRFALIDMGPWSSTSTRSWEFALEPPAGREGPTAGLSLGDTPGPSTAERPIDPAPPARVAPQATERPEPGAIFATLSDNRLGRPGPGRQARLSKSAPRPMDWTGYEDRERRADDPLSKDLQTLTWPDLEGGSEPTVPVNATSADGKRSGLGLGWRF